MKKALPLILAFTLIFCMSACGSARAEAASAAEPAPAPAEESVGPAHTGETVLIERDGLRFVALAGEVSLNGEGDRVIPFSLKNDTGYTLTPFIRGTVNGYYVPAVELESADGGGSIVSIAPGADMDGRIVFRSAFDDLIGENTSELGMSPMFHSLESNADGIFLFNAWEENVLIPTDQEPSPVPEGQLVYENEELLLTAVGARAEIPGAADAPYPCVILLSVIPGESGFEMTISQAEVNGIPLKAGDLCEYGVGEDSYMHLFAHSREFHILMLNSAFLNAHPGLRIETMSFVPSFERDLPGQGQSFTGSRVTLNFTAG